MKQSKLKSIPLLLIISLLVWSYYQVGFSTEILLPILTTIVCTILFFINNKAYLISMTLTLLFGLFNFIHFAPVTSVFGGGFPNLGIMVSFQLESLLLILIFVRVNFNEIKQIKRKYIKQKEDEVVENIDTKLEYFKRKFSKKTISELESFINSIGMDADAVKAAKILLDEK